MLTRRDPVGRFGAGSSHRRRSPTLRRRSSGRVVHSAFRIDSNRSVLIHPAHPGMQIMLGMGTAAAGHIPGALLLSIAPDGSCIAIDETAILLTLSLHHY